MIIPIVCFTCGQCIAHLYEIYKTLVERICTLPESSQSNIQIDEIQNNVQIMEYVKTIPHISLDQLRNINVPIRSPEQAAFMILGINRLCCRRMFLTQCDTYNLVNQSK